MSDTKLLRVYICCCGHVGIQDIEKTPECSICANSSDLDWLNVELDTFKADLEAMQQDFEILNQEEEK